MHVDNHTMGTDKFQNKLDTFSNHIYKKLSSYENNIVFSPFSIHAIGAMVWLGAAGETATELNKGLGLNTTKENQIGESYQAVLAKYDSSSILKMANKIYVLKGVTISSTYNELIQKQFLSSIEEIDFHRNEDASKEINGWVKKQTNNLITDLVPSGILNADTCMVLINAIHFKGDWANQFPKAGTRRENFFLNETQFEEIEMMSLNKKSFMYADLSELDAKALQMSYKDADLFMLILLPNRITGLKMLVEKLKLVSVSDIPSKMKDTEINVKFPKFKAEFSVELKKSFNDLGIKRMFTDSAEFSKMLKVQTPIHVSTILHKAYIDVNEEGTEAAAATAAVMMSRSMQTTPKLPTLFHADHPFFYAILNRNGYQFFAGNYVNPKKNQNQ